jgi:hypothetical protein
MQRVDRVACRGPSRQRVLGVIAARDFEPDAWKDAKSAGFIVVNLRSAFGDHALDAMAQVEEIICGVNQDLGAGGPGAKFEQFSQMVEELKNNPIVSALRAIGLEALTGLALRSLGYEQVELGRAVPWNRVTRDADVLGFRGDEVRVVECKACHRKKSVSSAEVSKFFTETVPAVKSWLRSSGRTITRCTAEIWTTGCKGKDAGDTLHKLKRPPSDEWTIHRIDEIKSFIPRTIRARGIELLNSIAGID